MPFTADYSQEILRGEIEMKSYMVLVKFAGDKTSLFLDCRKDCFWWCCEKASTPTIAAKRILAKIKARYPVSNDISVIGVETLTKTKVAAIKNAYEARGNVKLDAAGIHIVACLSCILSAVRFNAPEMINPD